MPHPAATRQADRNPAMIITATLAAATILTPTGDYIGVPRFGAETKLSRSFSSAPQTTDGRSFYGQTVDLGSPCAYIDPWRYTTDAQCADGFSRYAQQTTLLNGPVKATTAQTIDGTCNVLTGVGCNADGDPWRVTTGSIVRPAEWIKFNKPAQQLTA